MNTTDREQHTFLVFTGITLALFLSHWIAGHIPNRLGNYDVQPWLHFIKHPLVFNIPIFLLLVIGGTRLMKILMREVDAQTLKERQKEAVWLAKRSTQNRDDSKKFRPIL